MHPKRPALPPGLYAIADAGFGDPVVLGRTLYEAGCAVVQLRAKGWPPERVEQAAADLRAIAARTGALLIVNDHLDVAVAVGAHGVHLGLEDGDLRAARQRLPDTMLLGRSTRTLAQVDAAQADADYLGFGPIFATDTRPGLPEPRGAAMLAEAVARSPRPIVAIGGINQDNIGAVRASGVHAWAVIAAILRGPDIAEAARGFRQGAIAAGPRMK